MKNEQTSPPFNGTCPGSPDSSNEKTEPKVIDNGIIYQDKDKIYYYNNNDDYDSPERNKGDDNGNWSDDGDPEGEEETPISELFDFTGVFEKEEDLGIVQNVSTRMVLHIFPKSFINHISKFDSILNYNAI